MSRTRGASQRFHQDDGELLDKYGKPIPTGINPGARSGGVQHMDDGEIVPPNKPAPMPAPVSVSAVAAYRCDRSTIVRNMEAAELFRLLEVVLGSDLTAEITPEDFGKLPADVRRHFRRVTEQEIAARDAD